MTAQPFSSVTADMPSTVTVTPSAPVPSARVSRTVSAPFLAPSAATPGSTTASAVTGWIVPMPGQVTAVVVARYETVPLVEQVTGPPLSWTQSAVESIVYVMPPTCWVAGPGW